MLCIQPARFVNDRDAKCWQCSGWDVVSGPGAQHHQKLCYRMYRFRDHVTTVVTILLKSLLALCPACFGCVLPELHTSLC